MTTIRMTAAAFAVFVGLAMLAMWAVFLFTGQIPELENRPLETGLHLTVEIITAFFLIAAGAGLAARLIWGKEIYLFSMGMLLYSVIQAAGYFAQQRQFTFVGMFAVFAILDVMFTVLIIFEGAQLPRATDLRFWRTR